MTMPITSYRKILAGLNIPSKVEPTGNLPNPLNFTSISTNLSNPHYSIKTDVHPDLLKCSDLNMINEKYPDEEWLRVYTEGYKN